MCVSSNISCGTCLSKWNGKAWEEKFKCILPLKSWTLLLNKKLELCVEGQCDVLNFNLTVNVPVTDILNGYWIVSDRTLIKLRGVFDTKGIPDRIAKKFSNGFPNDWAKIAGKWVEYIQRGDSDAFNWSRDDSFASSDTTLLLAQVEEHLSERRGRLKEKFSPTKKQEESRAKELDKDSAMPPSINSRDQEPNLHSMVWSPCLPAHRVQEICKWVEVGNPTPNPLNDLELDTENMSRESFADSINPSDSASWHANKKRKEQRVQVSEIILQNSRNVVPQSTPLSNINESRVVQTLDFDISAVGKASDITYMTDTSDNVENVFRKPGIVLPGSKAANLKNNARSSSDVSSKFSLSQSATSSNSNLAEIPGTQMTRMLSNTYRPRRKPIMQKIERWRPVLGVDGLLKVQGYLLLNADMTAGQVLTTNTVVQWGHKKVETNDGKEFELVGEPHEKIPDDLRSKLLKPISCEGIISCLKEYQALKDPSDWGAEYELFYENDCEDETSNSRISHSMKSDRRHRTLSKMSRSSTRGPASACETTKVVDIAETPKSMPKTKLIESPDFQNSSSGCESESSPVRKSSRITERKMQGKYQSWKNKMSMRRSVNKQDGTKKVCDERVYINEGNQKDSIETPRKDNYTRGRGVTKLGFENVTWKDPEGSRMVLPSSCLADDSCLVSISPSRIKISYNNSECGRKTVQNISKNSFASQLQCNRLNKNSSEVMPSFTPTSSSPFRNNDSSTTSTSSQCSPLCSPVLDSYVHRSSKTVNTFVRMSSQSPVSRTTPQKSLQTSVRRNSSAPASLFHKTSKNHPDGITAKRLSPTKTTSKTPANKYKLRIRATETVGKTPKTRTGSRKSTKTDTKTPATKTDAKISNSAISVSEPSATLVSQSLTSKTPAVRNDSSNTRATLSCSSQILIPETSCAKCVTPSASHEGSNVKTRGRKTPVSHTSVSQTPRTRTSANKSLTTPTSGSRTSTTLNSAGKTPVPHTPASKTTAHTSGCKTPSTRTSANKTPTTRSSAAKTPTTRSSAAKTPTTRSSARKTQSKCVGITPGTCSSTSKTPASKPPSLLTTNSSRSSKRRKSPKMKEPWVVVQKLNVKCDIPSNHESHEVTMSKKGRAKSKMVKSVNQKTESTNSKAKKGKENARCKTKKATEKNTKTKAIKGKRKTEKERFPSTDKNENNADDNASDCSNLSDMSLGPSASVIFALNSSRSHRAPRTLKERKEMDERIKQMGKHLSNKDGAADAYSDDDPMANLLSSYQFTALPQEWCKHENILRQNRKRRRPSSSDCTTPPHSAFDDGFGNEDATSSVATPQLLMRPPDPKQVQSYLQRQRALNSRPQRPTRQVKKDKNYFLPDIDYSAAFRNDLSDSEQSSVVSDSGWS